MINAVAQQYIAATMKNANVKLTLCATTPTTKLKDNCSNMPPKKNVFCTRPMKCLATFSIMELVTAMPAKPRAAPIRK